MMTRFTLSMACLLILNIGLSVATAKEYTIAVAPTYIFAPFVVADEKGFFAEEGVDITLKYYSITTDFVNGIVHQRVDIGPLWNSTHADMVEEFISLGAFSYEDGDYRIVAAPEITPQDFTTHKIAFNFDIFPYRWFLYDYLNQHNITMSEVKVVLVNEDSHILKNLQMGRLKIALMRGKNAEQAIQEGLAVLLHSSLPRQTLTSVLMPRDAYTATPKEDLKKMFRGMIRAIDWITTPEHDEECLALLQEKLFALDPQFAAINSLETFRKMKTRLKLMRPHELYHYNTVILKETYATMKQVRAELGMSHDFEYAEVVDTSILLEVLTEMGLDKK